MDASNNCRPGPICQWRCQGCATCKNWPLCYSRRYRIFGSLLPKEYTGILFAFAERGLKCEIAIKLVQILLIRIAAFQLPTSNNSQMQLATALALFIVLLLSPAAALSLFGYTSSQGFCRIDRATGLTSKCFNLPFNINPAPASGVWSNANSKTFYVTSQNLSDSHLYRMLLAVDITNDDGPHTYWAANMSNVQDTFRYPLVGYFAALSSPFILADYLWLAQPGANLTRYWPVSASTNNWAAAYDTKLMQVWLFSVGNQLCGCSLSLKSCSCNSNTFNIVTAAYDPTSHNIFGLAQAAQNVILYSWDYLYPTSLLMIGVVPDVTVVPWSTTAIDEASHLTFITSAPSRALVTVNLNDASVVSTSGPLRYTLQAFQYV